MFSKNTTFRKLDLLMDKVQKLDSSKCNTPSSETFRIENITIASFSVTETFRIENITIVSFSVTRQTI
jgi:hypothetical protein